MNTTDKIINNVAVQLANKIIECANYKVLYEEAQDKLAEMQAQLEQAQTQLEQAQNQLNKVNQVLEAGEALKDLFDEVANELEKE